MPNQSRSTRTRRSWLFTVLASLALTAQFLVAFAPLAEGRQGQSMGAHVESGTTKGHYTHDDANCASCQAGSIHGTTVKADVPLWPETQFATTVIATVDRVYSADLFPQTNPRAPPSVI